MDRQFHSRIGVGAISLYSAVEESHQCLYRGDGLHDGSTDDRAYGGSGLAAQDSESIH